jgi:hypothetical protein
MTTFPDSNSGSLTDTTTAPLTSCAVQITATAASTSNPPACTEPANDSLFTCYPSFQAIPECAVSRSSLKDTSGKLMATSVTAWLLLSSTNLVHHQISAVYVLTHRVSKLVQCRADRIFAPLLRFNVGAQRYQITNSLQTDHVRSNYQLLLQLLCSPRAGPSTIIPIVKPINISIINVSVIVLLRLPCKPNNHKSQHAYAIHCRSNSIFISNSQSTKQPESRLHHRHSLRRVRCTHHYPPNSHLLLAPPETNMQTKEATATSDPKAAKKTTNLYQHPP